MVGNLFFSYLMQMLFTVGAIMIFGLLIFLTNKAVYKLSGDSPVVCYATGLIGTPIHEGSHALMCLLFWHKITEISLYRVSDDGVLGYVNHTYNPRNFWQQIGNFFIGTAPVVIGSGVILLFLLFFSNSSFMTMWNEITLAVAGKNVMLSLLAMFGKSFLIIFAPANFANGWWYLFLALSLCVALHLTLSPDDIKSAIPGLIFIAVIFFVIDFIFMFIEGFTDLKVLTAMTAGIVKGGSFLACFMMLSLTLSVALLVVVAVIRFIMWIVTRRKA